MEIESRVKKSLLNARVNLIFYFLTIVLSFFSRKIFLDTLGADFVGLTGTLQNLLGFLNLAELGIVTAIGYVLYKPIFDHDYNKINEIISVFGYLYSCIGKIILIAGCILSCFLPFIFPETGFDFGVIYFAYFSFLASSLIGYFINYRQTLLGADQKNYVVTAYFQTMNIVKTLIQMVSAYYTGCYYLWVAIELFFGVVYSFILNWKINQTYPWLKSEIRLGKQLFKKYPEVMRYTRQLFVHKIAGFTQNQTMPFLIYSFVSLKIVTFYSNYTIIIDKLSALLNSFLSSTDAGVGNLIAEGDKKKIINIYWEMMSFRFLVAGVSIYCLFIFIEPFISLWIGSEYILSKTVLTLILSRFFISVTRGTNDQFLFGYGLFYDVWAPVVESTIFIIVAFIGGHFLGLEGILLGGIISQILIIGIWKPYFLFNNGFNIKIHKYWLNWLKYFILTILGVMITYYINDFLWNGDTNTWKDLLLRALINFILGTIIIYIMLLLGTNGMKNFSKRILKIKL